MRRYICLVCGHVYDEAAGHPETGVAPETRWDDISDNWECPDCGAPKSSFVLEE